MTRCYCGAPVGMAVARFQDMEGSTYEFIPVHHCAADLEHVAIPPAESRETFHAKKRSIQRLTYCAKCGAEVEPERVGQRYCRPCHTAYNREWRKANPPSPLARRKQNARSYARVYQKRGKLRPRPCVDCGSANAQKHHEDYARPLDVIWLCRECHLRRHGAAPKAS